MIGDGMDSGIGAEAGDMGCAGEDAGVRD
jgi:hypothetical protein